MLKTENNFLVFGEQTYEYNMETLVDYIKEGKIEDAKSYINQYFMKSKNRVLYWCASMRSTETYSRKDIKLSFIPVIKDIISNNYIYFNPYQWFIEEGNTI